jgi:hypothetical protein
METVQPVAVIIGIVKGISLAYPELKSLHAFVLSIGVGIVLGLFNYFGLTVETGIVSALTATGVYQVSKKIGGS